MDFSQKSGLSGLRFPRNFADAAGIRQVVVMPFLRLRKTTNLKSECYK